MLPSDAELIATDDGIGNGLEIPADSTMCTPESILEGGWRCNEEAPNNEKQGSPAAQPRKIAAISPMADGLVGAAQSMLATLDAQIASAKEFLLTATAAKVAAAALVPRVKPGRPTNAAQLGKADRPVGVGSIRHFFKPTTAPVFHAPSPPPAAPQMPLPELAGLAPAAETEVGQGVLHPGGPRPRPRKAARTGEEGSARGKGENLHWRKPALAKTCTGENLHSGTIPWYSIRYPGIMCMMSGHGRAPACLPVPAAAEAVPLPRRGVALWESLRRTLVDLLRDVSRPSNGEVRGAFFRPPFFLVMCALCGRLRPSAASLHPLMLRLRCLYVSGWRRHACVWTVGCV